MNQSELEAKRCNQYQARENMATTGAKRGKTCQPPVPSVEYAGIRNKARENMATTVPKRGKMPRDDCLSIGLVFALYKKLIALLYIYKNHYKRISNILTAWFILATSGRSSQKGKRFLNGFGSRPANTINTSEKSRFNSRSKII